MCLCVDSSHLSSFWDGGPYRRRVVYNHEINGLQTDRRGPGPKTSRHARRSNASRLRYSKLLKSIRSPNVEPKNVRWRRHTFLTRCCCCRASDPPECCRGASVHSHAFQPSRMARNGPRNGPRNRWVRSIFPLILTAGSAPLSPRTHTHRIERASSSKGGQGKGSGQADSGDGQQAGGNGPTKGPSGAPAGRGDKGTFYLCLAAPHVYVCLSRRPSPTPHRPVKARRLPVCCSTWGPTRRLLLVKKNWNLIINCTFTHTAAG